DRKADERFNALAHRQTPRGIIGERVAPSQQVDDEERRPGREVRVQVADLAAEGPHAHSCGTGADSSGSSVSTSRSQPSSSILIVSTATAFALASSAGTAVNSLTQQPCRK